MGGGSAYKRRDIYQRRLKTGLSFCLMDDGSINWRCGGGGSLPLEVNFI